MKLVTVAEMQRLEQDCGVPASQLMENAGLAVAQEAWLMLGEVAERRVLVLVGPGNNGGDGLVAARHLKEWGADVICYLLKARERADPVYDAAAALEIPMISASDKLAEALGGAELVIDALLGTGRGRPIEGVLADVLDRLKDARGTRMPPRLIAVDLPTGLDPDTGAVDEHCVAADETVALGFAKVGPHLQPGARYTGRVEVVDIGIPTTMGESVQTELLSRKWAQEHLPERPADAHKGTFGSVMVVAGSPSYTGAAYLSCTGSMRVGAGITTLAAGRSIHPVLASKLTETTFELLDDKDGELTAEEAYAVLGALKRGYECLLVGPGLGQSGYVQAFLRGLLPSLTTEPAEGTRRSLKALIIDADGLNNLATIPNWPSMLKVPTVLTPHPGEMARLTGLSVDEVQADRLSIARKYAAEWSTVVLFKGAPTIVAAPDGRARVNTFANPGIATGGTGDVLAGAIAGFVAQGVEPFDAACLALYVSSVAGEMVRQEMGSAGMLAGDLAQALPRAMKDLRGEGGPSRSSPQREDILSMLTRGMAQE